MIDAYEEAYDSSDAWEELKVARLEACTFRILNWAGADLCQSRFEDCTFLDCDLFNIKALVVSFQDVRFERCNLEASTWQEMDVRGF